MRAMVTPKIGGPELFEERDGAPSHRSEQIGHPENVSLLRLPAYSSQLNPVERWFQEFRRARSPTGFSRP